MIGINKTKFYIKFESNVFNKNDMIINNNKQQLKILETPHKKWYKILLQFITFKLYKAPTQYKVKLT